MARERKFSTEELFQSTKHLLLLHGYEGFTFSLLADRLEVSRGTLYKYYDNKEELITDFMIDEMNQFLFELKQIDCYNGFVAQFDYLLGIMFKNSDIHNILGMVIHISENATQKTRDNKENLDKLHLDMYGHLQNFIKLGKEENKLKSHLADGLILGIIFQSITIPNHFGIPHSEWVQSIKEVISEGMLTKIN